MVEDPIEIDGLELHTESLHTLSFLLIADKLFDIAVNFLLFLIFIIRLIGGISFPSHLFLFSKSCLLILVLTFEANTELSALDALIEALAIFFLTVRLFASTEVEVLDSRLVGMSVLVVMHVSIVFLFQ